MSKGFKVNKFVLKNILILAIVILLPLLLIATLGNNKIRDVKDYNKGKDIIPSVTSVVGKREIVELNNLKTEKQDETVYKYATEKPFDDINKYYNKLKELGYTVESNSQASMEILLIKGSLDSGKIVNIKINYDDKSYSISVQKKNGVIPK